MRRSLVSVIALAAILSGCGTHIAPTAGSAASALIDAQSKTKKKGGTTNAGLIDDKSAQAGILAGLARTKATRQDIAPPGSAGAQTPNGLDPVSYAYGFAVGEVQGALNSYSRINGSFDVYQWKAFAYMLEGAMKDAQATLGGNPALAAHYGLALGILTGGIQSFDSINGSFDVNQWQSFSDTNRNVLQNALSALKNTP